VSTIGVLLEALEWPAEESIAQALGHPLDLGPGGIERGIRCQRAASLTRRASVA
jgi:hypothetical protein